MPPDARRYEILLSLNPISPGGLAAAGRQWPRLLDGAPRPVIALLVGGDASRFRLGADDAAVMASKVRSWAEENGGSVIAVTSRRTSQIATEALKAALRHPHRVYAWQPEPTANPYRALLAQADVLVVTGESESMLAEAAATTAPVYIFPVREVKSDRLSSRVSEWGVRRAYAYFSQGSTGAAAGAVDASLAWMMRCGLLRPRRNLSILHEALYASGRARSFGAPLQTAPQQPLREAPEVARWLKRILR
jgi:mitochondrial fission protein ELM1